MTRDLRVDENDPRTESARAQVTPYLSSQKQIFIHAADHLFLQMRRSLFHRGVTARFAFCQKGHWLSLCISITFVQRRDRSSWNQQSRIVN